jgi:hypothetical protein
MLVHNEKRKSPDLFARSSPPPRSKCVSTSLSPSHFPPPQQNKKRKKRERRPGSPRKWYKKKQFPIVKKKERKKEKTHLWLHEHKINKQNHEIMFDIFIRKPFTAGTLRKSDIPTSTSTTHTSCFSPSFWPPAFPGLLCASGDVVLPSSQG